MTKQLICPKCESPKVKQERVYSLPLGSIRECLHCAHTSIWFSSKELTKSDKDCMDGEWQSWNCQYLEDFKTFENKVRTKELFEQNTIGGLNESV